MRRSVFYTMTQAERRGRLHCSNWPDLDWENEWVMLSTYDDFDRSIDMDARSGKLQEVFDIPYDGPYDLPRTVPEGRILLENVSSHEEAMEYLQQVKERCKPRFEKNEVKDWSKQWDLC